MTGAPLRRAAVAIAVLSVLAVVGCGRESPEARLRRTIAAGREAAEGRDFGRLGDLVSDRYADDEGRDRAALLQLVRGYLAFLEPAHVFYKEESLRLTAPGRAEVTLLVAVASVPLNSLADLDRASAELGRVDLVFEEEGGEWKLVRAHHGPASLSDWL